MRKLLMILFTALTVAGSLLGQEISRTLVVKPVFATTQNTTTDWGGAYGSINLDPRYEMQKVEGADNLYKCTMRLKAYFKTNKWKSSLGEEYNPLSPNEGWNNSHQFVVVYQDNYGDQVDKNNPSAVEKAQYFDIETDDTEVTFYAAVNTDGGIRSYCDALRPSVYFNGTMITPSNKVFELPSARGETSTSAITEVNGSGKIEVSMNKNILSPNGGTGRISIGSNIDAKYLFKVDFRTLTYSTAKVELLNEGTDADLILTGKWNEDIFNAYISSNLATVTTIDFTGVTEGLAMLPVVENLNPNCLMYVNSGLTVPDGMNNVVEITDETAVARNLVLREGNYFNNTKAFKAMSASYTRTFTDNGWVTMCLPFNATRESDLIIEGFTGINANGNALFERVESITANIPYLANTSATGEKVFSGAEADVPVTTAESVVFDGYVFNPNYRKLEGMDVAGLYLLNSDGSAFARVSQTNPNGSYVAAFRAYFQTPVERSLSIIHGEGSATNIDVQETDRLVILPNEGSVEVISNKAQIVNIYALDGQLIKSIKLNEGSNIIGGLGRGIYLANRQKVVVK